MFGRMPTLPIDVIMGMPQADTPDSALRYTHETVDNLQYELARHNLGECANAEAASNADYGINSFSLVI